MGTHPTEMQPDESVVPEPDRCRNRPTPPPSRAEAGRLRLEEHPRDRIRPHPDSAPPTAGASLTRETLSALYTLDRIPGFGPMKFRAMHEAGITPQTALEHPERLPIGGRTGEKLRAAIRALSSTDRADARSRADEQWSRATEYAATILVHGDPRYPERVYASNNPVPVLYVRGDPAVWAGRGAVAVVGSRGTRDPYADYARRIATVAAHRGMLVVSGFALGADSIGHRAARDAGGRTLCVMPCGLDKVFPPENRPLWEALLADSNAAFVSEFGFGMRASSLQLRKRNKLIVAFADGVLVAQSAVDGGAMIACRFGREQKKPVATFRSDGTRDTTGNAAIARDTRTGCVVFEPSDGPSEYARWLDVLSASISAARGGTAAHGPRRN